MNHFINVKKNKPKNRVLALFLLLGVVCTHTIPIFAENIGTRVTASSIKISAGTITYYDADNTNYAKVPIYLTCTFANTDYADFVTGVTQLFSSFKDTFYFTNNGTNLTNYYFIPDTTNGISIQRYNDTFPVLVLDNFINNGGANYVGDIIIPYKSSTDTFIVSVVGSGTTLTTYTQYFYKSSSQLGFAESMVYAIQNSADVDEMLTLLDSIATDSKYLGYIMQDIRSNHTALYALIQQVLSTDQAILTVSQNSYTALLRILSILESEYLENESEAESQVAAIDDELGQLELDMNVAKPSAVANIADEYVNQIDTTYNSNVFGFLNFPTIILLMCIVMAFAIISYMLYGGQ